VSEQAQEISNPFHEFQAGFNVIIDLITPGAKVLDLGCGSGTLLARLGQEKDIEGCGVELDQEKVVRCNERGIRVLTLDLDRGLEGFPDLSYDYVVLSRTLQQLARPEHLVREMLRVGSKSIIAFPNFGQWKVRVYYLLTGRTPVSQTFPLPWYNSPDIHRITVYDFRHFVNDIGGRIEKEIFILENEPRVGIFWPNIRAEWGCVQISAQ
jgi:methionine biosynthesis protein MetW